MTPAERLRSAPPGTAPVAVALAAAGVLGVVGVLDPNQAGHYPTCPFLALTGLYCPGCGTLRALHALAHGHPLTAFGSNPLAMTLLPVLGLAWLLWTRRVLTGRPPARVVPAALIWLLLAVVIAFWILRNLPGLQVLAP